MVYHRSEGSGSRTDRTVGAPSPSSQSAAAAAAAAAAATRNVFRNDGSFLEMFKKMQGGKPSEMTGEKQTTSESSSSSGPAAGSLSESKPASESEVASGSAAKKPQPFVGKRRGGRVLPTGMVKKKKTEEDEDKPKDAWSLYMAEVRRYKETSCEEDGKTRPLVK